ncbi:hypothetical protein LOK49_Contig10G00007 [Camellia lanceoleosa]|nr:hypothetical protein LOK49_Contig10G00007 [Camellia lanceoleosa]
MELDVRVADQICRSSASTKKSFSFEFGSVKLLREDTKWKMVSGVPDGADPAKASTWSFNPVVDSAGDGGVVPSSTNSAMYRFTEAYGR